MHLNTLAACFLLALVAPSDAWYKVSVSVHLTSGVASTTTQQTTRISYNKKKGGDQMSDQDSEFLECSI